MGQPFARSFFRPTGATRSAVLVAPWWLRRSRFAQQLRDPRPTKIMGTPELPESETYEGEGVSGTPPKKHPSSILVEKCMES